MQGTVLAETEAFITRQRELLLQQRQELLNQQQALQQQLDEVFRKRPNSARPTRFSAMGRMSVDDRPSEAFFNRSQYQNGRCDRTC